MAMSPDVQKMINKISLLLERNEQKVLEPYLHIKQVPTKQIRSQLFHAINQWMKIPKDKLDIIERTINLLYEGMVILDDTLDNTMYCRGIPAAHRIFGYNRTMISGTAIFTFALNEVLELKNLKAVQIYVDEVLRYYGGLAEEADFYQFSKCPTYEEYLNNVKLRTLPALNLPFKLMQVFSDCKRDYSKLAELFTEYYQILNDYSSLYRKGNWHRKGICDDITEGKFTHAMIHAVNTGTLEGQEVHNILRLKTTDVGLIKYCLHLLEKLGSIEFARKAALEYEKKLRDEINRLGGNAEMEEVIALIDEWKNDDTVADDNTFLKEADLIDVKYV